MVTENMLVIAWTPYRSYSGPSGPKPPKSWKKVPGASRPRGRNVEIRFLEKGCFESVSALVRLFLNPFHPLPGAERVQEPSFNLLRVSGPKGPNDFCMGPRRLDVVSPHLPVGKNILRFCLV